MSTITLENIKAEQAKLNAMIASFEAKKTVYYLFPIIFDLPALKKNEKWVGTIISAGGRKNHVILLPGEKTEINWKDANKWANTIGGQLPDRVESALLFSCMKDEFKEEAYWTCEEHKGNDSWAWYQLFYDGNQINYFKDGELRARAVRRELVI